MKTRHKLWAVCLSCVLGGTISAEAQESNAPKGNAVGLPLKVTIGRTPQSCNQFGTIEELVAEYQDWSKWPKLQTRLGKILKDCNIVSSPSTAKPVLITLVNGDQAHNVVYPQPTAYSQTLKGVDTVTVVVIVGSDEAQRMKSIDMTLMSSKVENPIAAQIPEFIKSIVSAQATPVPIRIQGVDDTRTLGGTPPKLAIYKSSELKLPFTRATVVETGTTVSGKAGAPNDDKPESNVKATVNVSYANRSDSVVELQAIAGAFVGKVSGHEKMKVDSGKYAADPISRALTMAAVAIHFAPFSDAEKVNELQRWALLAGGVLTPAPGLGVGLSRRVLSNFAVNFGWAAIWVPTAPDVLKAGDAVVTEGKQLVFRWSSGVFIGGGYAFGSK